MPGLNVIAIGASAGGIQVLQKIVSGIPNDFRATIFVVVHTTSEDGHLADVLARKSSIPTVKARDGMHIARRTIYVAPPNHHLIINDSHVSLSTGPKVNRHRPAIDPLFESAAIVFHKRLIGVVLSGYLDDGTAGLLAVKNHGGIAIVQDPGEAYAPNMPKSALAHVQVDYCVPVAEIAPLLVRLTRKKESAEQWSR